jgi:hypothetical protein
LSKAGSRRTWMVRRSGAGMACDLWLKGLQPVIGASSAINVPLGATSYPQVRNVIVTLRNIPLIRNNLVRPEDWRPSRGNISLTKYRWKGRGK